MWIAATRPKGLGQSFYVALIAAAIAAACPVARAQSPGAADASATRASAADTARREAAVLAARDGDYADALATLRALASAYPDDRAILHDLVTVLAWSENDTEAVTLADAIDRAAAPRHVQLAVAKSARNIQRFDIAAAWYNAALEADPNDIDALTGRLMTAGDAGDSATVRALLARTETLSDAANDASVPIRLARGYALRAIGDSLPALRAYDAVLASEPANAEALRGKALVLRSMLLPTQALELAAGHPGILSEAEIERLRTDEAAIRLRLTSRTPYPGGSADANRERSVALIDASLTAATTTAGRDALLLDRVVALSDANAAEAAIAQFESLPPTANRDQPYVLAAAARAYLEAEQPETALELLIRARELDPANLEVHFALVYAWLDLDRYDEAYALAAELTGSLPLVNQAGGSNVIKGNEDRMRAELLAGIADAYGDQLDAAQLRFETLLVRAPNNHDLRQELANVYRWRGWLDRSLGEYRQVRTMNGDLLSAELGHAHAQLDAREYAAVEMTVAEVSASYASEPAVRQLAERWEIHNEREFVATASTGDSSGPIAGSNNYTVDLRWYTAPIAYRYRAFVTTHDGYAEFPEGEARRRRLGAGIEYRLPRFTVTAEASASRSGDTAAGIAGEAEYRLSDFWTVAGGLELDSDAVQLRAARVGIEADRAFASARYAPSELASARFGYDIADYSDGNSLSSLYGDGRYRVLNRPRAKLDVTGSVAVGSATTSAVPYFSPTRDRTLMAGVEHRFRIHRRYARELNQTASVATGRYAQQGFATGSIWAARYRVDWSLSERHALAFEAARLGQFFDGEREHSTIFLASVNSRF